MEHRVRAEAGGMRCHAAGVAFWLTGADPRLLVALPGRRRIEGGLVRSLGFEPVPGQVSLSVREVAPDLALGAFCRTVAGVLRLLTSAERRLARCGLSFADERGLGRPAPLPIYDGHRARSVHRERATSDGQFQFVQTRLTGEPFRSIAYRERWGKGWTFHYRPVEGLDPLTAAALEFLGLAYFDACPEFSDAACYWRFLPLERRWLPFLDNEGAVRRQFRAHQHRFSRGIGELIAAHEALEPFGMGLFDFAGGAWTEA